MALEDKEKKEYKEFLELPEKELPKPFKVLKEFTLDRLYKVGNSIELLNGKTKDVLISNKFIK